MGDGIFLLIPILFPIVAGLVVFAINHRIARQIYVGTVLVLNAIAVFLISFLTETSSFTLWKFSDSLSITFRFDGVGKIFACLIAVIWTVACIYAFEYMKHEGKEKTLLRFCCNDGRCVNRIFPWQET
ncbi:MAG: hypothetical protein ACLTE2_07740 [Eubacteriales bacterium]